MNFNIEVPINPVSFGQSSTLILLEFWKKQLQPCVFLIGDFNLSAFDKLPPDFVSWLQSCINKAIRRYSRSNPCFRLWHCQGSHATVSNATSLLTFLELDQISEFEENILKNQKNVLVTSKFTQSILNNYNIKSEYCPLGFDSMSFSRLDKRAYDDNRIVFFVGGKAEKRKHTRKILRAFKKRFGNQREFMLHTAIFNPFLGRTPEEVKANNAAFIHQSFDGNIPWNTVFLDYQPTNSLMNGVYNSGDISINVSGAEGMDLVLLNMLGLQKHALVLNAHVYKDYTTSEMVTYIEPHAKEKAVDNIFFHENSPFGIGNIFDVSEEAIIEGMEKAVEKYKKNPINSAAASIAKDYTWEKTADIILNTLKK